MSNVIPMNPPRLAFVDCEGNEFASILPGGVPQYDWALIAQGAQAYDAGQVEVETAIAKLRHHFAPLKHSVV